MEENAQLKQLEGWDEDGGVGVGGVVCEQEMKEAGLGAEVGMVVARGRKVVV